MWSLPLIVLSALGLAAAENLADCGGARYYPSQYTCYDGNFLCPKINAVATKRCGSACYPPGMYTCTNNKLVLLPADNGPFTLVAQRPGAAFDGKSVEACGRYFWIGKGPCTYCPDTVGTCPAGKVTGLYAGQAMDVEVPGGQEYYLGPKGALGFTIAHSAQKPAGYVEGCSAYKGGEFKYLPGAGWYACPVAGKTGQWQVYQKLPNVNLVANNCVGMNILVKDMSGVAAWEYT